MKKLLLLLVFFPLAVFAQQQTNVALQPVFYGGSLIFRSIDLDESEEEITDSQTNIYGWFLFNASAGVRYFKFYNATAANTIVGTTTPVITIGIPAGAGANVSFPEGIQFRTALTAACVTGVADNSTGAPGANDCIANIFYKD